MAKKCIKTLSLPGKGLFISILLSIFVFYSPLSAQNQKKKEEPAPALKEYVEVVNVAMTLRALKHGHLVSGLKESDFIMTENGKKLDVTSFTEIHRKIGEKEEIALESQQKIEKKKRKKRLFLFYFWVQEKHVEYRKSLEYFFKNVYLDEDIALLIIKNKVIKITTREEVPAALKELDEVLKSREEEWRKWIDRMARNQQKALNNYFEVLLNLKPYMEEIPPQVLPRLQMLRQLIEHEIVSNWGQYRYRFLTANSNQLLELAESLKSIPLEKWGFVYYQHMPFPVFDGLKIETAVSRFNVKEANELGNVFRKYVLEMQKPPSAQLFILPVKRAFMRADTTFHLLLPDTKTMLDLENPHMVLKDVYSSWYNTFRQITVSTGGEIVTSNMLVDSMRRVIDKEDVYYRVTFRPRNLKKFKKERKIKVSSKIKGLDVHHESKVEVRPAYGIELSDITFQDQCLSMIVKNYALLGAGVEQSGTVVLTVACSDEQGIVQEFSKKISLQTTESIIRLKMKLPQNKKTTLLITVSDLLTGIKNQKTFTIGK